MISQFIVNIEKYDSSGHEILMSTTEYKYRATILAVQTIHKGLSARIQQSLHKIGAADAPYEVLYYITKPLNSKCRQISQSAFNSRFEKFRQKDFDTVKEICELYRFKDKNGDPASAVITALKKKDEELTATIEFNSVLEAENFVLPEWLSPAI